MELITAINSVMIQGVVLIRLFTAKISSIIELVSFIVSHFILASTN
jgi:hypothetical protein